MSTLAELSHSTVPVTLPERCYSPEEHLALRDHDRFELVDGRLVERNLGAESAWVGGQIHFFLAAYCRQHSLG